MQSSRRINSNLFLKGFIASLFSLIHLSGAFTVSPSECNESECQVIHVDVYQKIHLSDIISNDQSSADSDLLKPIQISPLPEDTVPTQTQASNPGVSHVEVYYDAKDLDCIDFILNQLIPMYDENKEHLDMSFIPQSQVPCGDWKNDCVANQAQLCAIRKIESSQEESNRQQLIVDLVYCTETGFKDDRDGWTVVYDCSQSIGLLGQTQEEIKDCINDTLSNDLLVANGDKAAALDPPLTFIPTIVVNNDRYEPREDKDITDLRDFML